jgi:hypothetical protein
MSGRPVVRSWARALREGGGMSGRPVVRSWAGSGASDWRPLQKVGGSWRCVSCPRALQPVRQGY